jgi:hypothetical protein
MNVRVWAREVSRMRAEADGYAVSASREAFFEECDIFDQILAYAAGAPINAVNP